MYREYGSTESNNNKQANMLIWNKEGSKYSKHIISHLYKKKKKREKNLHLQTTGDLKPLT